MKKLYYWIILIAISVGIIISSCFSIPETEIALLTHFGKPKTIITDAGLHLKWPDPIESIIRFNRRILQFDSKPIETLTLDKKNLVVDTCLFWRIKDLMRFYQTVKDRLGAELRLADMLISEVCTILGRYPLSNLFNMNTEDVEIDTINKEIYIACRNKALESYGIEVVDAKLKRINLPEQNRKSVFQRMESDRRIQAKKYRAEGLRDATKIRAEAEKEKSDIMSEAYQKAQEIKGMGDAEAMKIYAEAYRANFRFYKLTRLLEAYKNFMDENTTLILSSNSAMMELINSMGEFDLNHKKKESEHGDKTKKSSTP
jgi:membrane protease subunit HflC